MTLKRIIHTGDNIKAEDYLTDQLDAIVHFHIKIIQSSKKIGSKDKKDKYQVDISSVKSQG